METIFRIVLILHVITGITSFIVAPLALASKKGASRHKLFGSIFFYAMMVVSFSSIALASIHHSPFFLHLGIFTFYMNYSGRRSIRNKSLKASRADIALLCIATGNSLFMLASAQLVLGVFGGLSAYFCMTDMVLFRKTRRGTEMPQNSWLIRHIGRMMGTYIAATTAFLVVNIRQFEPAWLPWLAPTFIGTVVIIYFIRKNSPRKSV